MRLAFVLYKYFPYGGLQRDMLKIARVCLELHGQMLFTTDQFFGQRIHFFTEFSRSVILQHLRSEFHTTHEDVKCAITVITAPVGYAQLLQSIWQHLQLI